jgi:long-chain acyl-CoA synthetase
MSIIEASTLALQRLYHWEGEQPQTVSLIQPMGGGVIKEFTRAEVGNQVRRMAAHLQAMGREQGWEPGAKVAILSKNCAWWLMSDLAIWMAGYVSVPLYPTLAHETIAQILKHSEARACFVGKLDGWEGMKPGVPANLPCIAYPVSPADAIASFDGWDAICARTQAMPGHPVREGKDLATLIYTSGTTGVPKGVMHSFDNFAWAINTAVKRVPMGPEDRMLSYLPLAHVVERMLVEHGWLYSGMRLFFAESLDTFAADLQRARPTIFFSVPRLWVKFQQGVHAKLPPAKLQRLLSIPLLGGLVRRKILRALGLDQCRMAFGGAAPMPLALLEWYAKLGLPINEGYGMTENLAASHLTIPGQNQRGTVGPPYDGVEARIAPDNGELQMRSPALMLGYYKEPELTRQTFTEDGWLRTGDKATMDANGCVRITGRVKDLFKTSKGKYVAPAPIEDRLMLHSAVEACVVTGADLGQPLALVLMSAESVQLAGDSGERDRLSTEFARHLDEINARLDPHEQLACVVLLKTPWTVDNGLITPTFKVKRNSIDELFALRYESWAGMNAKVIWGD